MNLDIQLVIKWYPDKQGIHTFKNHMIDHLHTKEWRKYCSLSYLHHYSTVRWSQRGDHWLIAAGKFAVDNCRAFNLKHSQDWPMVTLLQFCTTIMDDSTCGYSYTLMVLRLNTMRTYLKESDILPLTMLLLLWLLTSTSLQKSVMTS